MAGNRGQSGVSVTSRIVRLLEAFDADHRSLTLSEIARRSDTPLSTAHRLVGDLVDAAVLSRRSSGDYVIGRKVWNLGLLAPLQSGLRQVASPFLQDIYGATLATVHLAMRDGDEVLYIDRVSGHRSVPIVSQVGTRLPMHATGVGKVLLAYAPESVQTSVMENLTRVTAYTITQSGRLAEELHRVHREGYASTSEEMSLGACSVAVPIFVSDKRVVASIGIVVPSLKREKQRLITALQVAAHGIGRSRKARSTGRDQIRGQNIAETGASAGTLRDI